MRASPRTRSAHAARDALREHDRRRVRATRRAAQVIERLERGADRQRPGQRHGRGLGARPAARRAERWVEVDTPAGPMPALLPPALPAEPPAAHGPGAGARRSTPTRCCAELGYGGARDRRAARSDGASEGGMHETDTTFPPPRSRVRRRAALRRDPRAGAAPPEDLLLDWLGSALAGKGARPVEAIARFAPRDGPGRRAERGADPSPRHAARCSPRWSMPRPRTSPSRTTCTTARCSIRRRSSSRRRWRWRRRSAAPGRELLAAAVAGYEVGIRVGEFLGRSHYRIFHTTGTAGTLAAAAAAGRLLGSRPERMGHAFGSAGTQAAGLWEFLRDAADSKQLHTAHAASTGPDVGLPRARRVHRRAPHPRRARRAWPRACRAMPIRRG